MKTTLPAPLLRASGTALSIGVASALFALIGEVGVSLFAIVFGVESFLSEATFKTITLIAVVVVEEVVCYTFARSFQGSLRRWVAPILLGLGFFLVESSLYPILIKHTFALPPVQSLPVLFIHISTFAVYLSSRNVSRLSLGIGISIHLLYNLVVFLSATPFVPALISTLVTIGMVSLFLARLDAPRYTGDELN